MASTTPIQSGKINLESDERKWKEKQKESDIIERERNK